MISRHLAIEAPRPGERWLVAFSGGPDSTALALGLSRVAGHNAPAVHLAHVDHGLDAGSARRAEQARLLARQLGLPFHLLSVDAPAQRRRHESPEAGARRVRYRALEGLRRELGAGLLLTAHHRDDHLETILLQLLRGVPVESMRGIPERRGPIRRPLLARSRKSLLEALRAASVVPVEDPTNLDLTVPRNRIRHLVLPGLRAREPELDAALLRLARFASALRGRLDRVFRERLDDAGGRWLAKRDFLGDLPEPLGRSALRWLLRERIGLEHAPSRPSLDAFLAALGRGEHARLPLEGGAEELVAWSDRLEIAERESSTPSFSYTFQMPGGVALPEIGLGMRIRRSPVEAWMFRGDPRRVGFLSESVSATVRNRRPGDRIRPLGAPGARKLKELLIDRRIPAAERDRIPLLDVGGRLAWVPGVTLDEAFRLRGESECWMAELESL